MSDRIAKLENDLEKLETLLEKCYDDPSVSAKHLSRCKSNVDKKKREIEKEKKRQESGGKSSNSCLIM